jgi:hypothetical protein
MGSNTILFIKHLRRICLVKILVALALALALALGAAGIAVAQTSMPGSTSPKKTASRTASGTVKSSSMEAVVVAGRDKGKDAEWTFAVEPTTNIRKGGKSIIAGDLKRGDAVQVRFTEQGGKAMARSIVVKSKDVAATKKPKP